MNLTFVNRQNKNTKKELLLFKAVEKCDLSDYIVYDKTFDESGSESNVFPHMYRFPSITLEKGEYVALRLHKGKNNKGQTVQKDLCYNVFWGMDENVSIFNDEGDRIHLVKIAKEETFSIKPKSSLES